MQKVSAEIEEKKHSLEEIELQMRDAGEKVQDLNASFDKLRGKFNLLMSILQHPVYFFSKFHKTLHNVESAKSKVGALEKEEKELMTIEEDLHQAETVRRFSFFHNYFLFSNYSDLYGTTQDRKSVITKG